MSGCVRWAGASVVLLAWLCGALMACLRSAAVVGLALLLGVSVAQAVDLGAELYRDVIPVPNYLQPDLQRIPQPHINACVPTCASMILKDIGLPVNLDLAAGHYTPGETPTKLYSAARDLHFSGNINSHLYLKEDIQANPALLRQIAQNGRSAIVAYNPGVPVGHALVVDGMVTIGNTPYYIIRDPWQLRDAQGRIVDQAPHGGYYLKPASTFEPHIRQLLEPLPRGVPPDLRFNPQRTAAGGPFDLQSGPDDVTHALDDELARLQQDLQHYQTETAGQSEKKQRVEGEIGRLQEQIRVLRHETQLATRSRTEQEKKLAELQREIDDLLTISAHLQSSGQEDCVIISGESLKNVCPADHKR